jgi:membrane protease YdiL (CAAX protease family)
VQTGGYWPALVVIFLCGWVLAWLREASASLWPSILFHMGFNFTALLPVLLLGQRLVEFPA